MGTRHNNSEASWVFPVCEESSKSGSSKDRLAKVLLCLVLKKGFKGKPLLAFLSFRSNFFWDDLKKTMQYWEPHVYGRESPMLIRSEWCLETTKQRNPFFISWNESRGTIFFFAPKGSNYSKGVIISNIAHWKSNPKYMYVASLSHKKKLIITSDILNMGCLSVPNLVPWLIFSVSVLGVRDWIINDFYCVCVWIRLHFSFILQIFNVKGRG